MENLRRLRLERGLSQQKLADLLNTSQQSIYKYENAISEPDISTLKRLADYFETSIDYLTGNTEISRKYEQYIEEALNAEELEHLRSYRKLSVERRKLVDMIIMEYLK